MRPAAVSGPIPADTHGKHKGAATNANAGHVGPHRQVREMCSPQQFREVALYSKRNQGRPQQAELSGAAHADEEMDDGAVRFRIA